nr:DUF1674 domain-containing protein [Phyllobacterium salinisoli]
MSAKRTDLSDLPPAALRALKEAEARRQMAEAEEKSEPREIGGRGGRDPARFGDWEIKGRAIDF